MSEESPGSGKMRKNFENDPRASWQGRTTQWLHAPAGRRSRPEMAIDAPHYAISMLDAGCHWRVVGTGSWSSCGEEKGGPLSGLCSKFWLSARVPAGGREYMVAGAKLAPAPGNYE